MQRSRTFARRALTGAAVLALICAGATTILVNEATLGESSSDRAVVTRIVDGDTFSARVNGEDQVIRMLNIDTPETKHPNGHVECLGPEATQHLETLIPIGTTVTLEYDVERTDRYGRTLAGVFTSSTFVNAEMARAGFAEPLLIEPNKRFHAEVLDAHDQAVAEERGLFSLDVPCSPPAQPPGRR